VKVGDLVRVTNQTGGLLDTLEMTKLVDEGTPLLLWLIKYDIGWAHVLDGGAKRIVPMHRLEVISDAK